MVEDVKDNEVPTMDSGPVFRPTFGRRMAFGTRISEIRARCRLPRLDDPLQAQHEEDVYQKMALIADEYQALHNILSSWGLINGSGESQDGGQGGGGGQYYNNPDVPWLDNWENYIRIFKGMMIQIRQMWVIIKRMNFILQILIDNKMKGGGQGGSYGGSSSDMWQQTFMFDHGIFFGGYILDKDSRATMTMPGTNVDAGWLAEFPAASKAWFNRMYGDLHNGRIHAVIEPGSWEHFFTVGKVGWAFHEVDGVYRLDDPGSNTPDVEIGYGGNAYVLPSARPGSTMTMQCNAAGACSFVTGVAPSAHASSHHVAGSDPIDHDALTNFLASEHFTEASINHTNILGIGTNSHAIVDIHLADRVKHVNIQATMPVTPSQGQVVYKTADDCFYVYESTRSKWLSVNESAALWGSINAALGSNHYAAILNTPTHTAQVTGDFALHDGTVVGVTVAFKNTVPVGGTVTVAILANGASIATLAIAAGSSSGYASNLDGDFSAGDRLSVAQTVAGGATSNKPFARIFYRRRTS